MEEVSHVFLGHKPNRLAIVEHGRNPTVREGAQNATKRKKQNASKVAVDPHPNPLPKGEGTKILARDYNKSDEEAAYAIGSAALVPYAALRKLVLDGRTADQIARGFRVSRQLVEYRIKVTHLWSAYKSLSGSRVQHV
jgi:hypothetical protein